MTKRLLRLVVSTAALCSFAAAASFTAGSVVVYRVGNGSAALSSAAAPGFLDEYSATGTLIQSIALPTTDAAPNKAFVAAGSATSDGMLTLSVNGQYLVVSGYSAAVGTAGVASASPGTVPRVVARVGTDGSIDTTTALTDTALTGNARSAATISGTAFWTGNSAGGTRYIGAVGPTNSTTGLATTPANIRTLGIFGGQLYASSSSGAFLGVSALGSGLPISSGQTYTLFASSASANGFFFADLNPAVPGVDTLYIADDGSGSGLKKYSLVGSTWTLNNTIAIGSLRGLTGTVSGSTVTLYGTSQVTPSVFVRIDDATGYNVSMTASPVTLATAATNTAFRGVAIAPQDSFLSPATLTSGTSGTAYSQAVSVTGGNACTYALASGSTLPANLSLNAATGEISGTPVSGGPASFTITGTCVNLSSSRDYTLQVDGGTNPTNPSAAGTATNVVAGNSTTFSGTIAAGSNPTSTGLAVVCDLSGVGGSGAFGMSVTGSTFSGSYLVPASVAGATYTLPCTVSDTQSRASGFNISLAVTAAPTVVINPTTIPSGTEGTSYSQTITGTGGTSCTFASTGTVPPGLSLSSAGVLSGIPTLAGSFAFTVNATCSNGTASQLYTASIALACETGTKTSTAIHTIQGTGLSSTLTGQKVEVEGIVVGSFQGSAKLLGFYLQEPDSSWDNDPLTSEGIFVFDNGTGPAVNIGDRVRVAASVSEFTTSGSFLGVTQSASQTELSTITSELVCSPGNTFTRTAISLPADTTTSFEAYEGMAVQFNQQLAVTGNFNLGTFGQVDIAPSLLYTPTVTADQSTWAATLSLNNRSAVQMDDGSNLSNSNLYPTLFPQGGLSASNTLRSGDLINYDAGTQTTAPLVGVLDNRFGAYRILPTSAVTFYSANPRPAVAPILASTAARFRAVSANVLNFFTTLNSRGAATATEFNHQKTKVIEALSAMNGDVYGLSEVQNFANGNTNGGTYTNLALQSLVDGLNCKFAGFDALCTGAASTPTTPYALIDTLGLGAVNGTDAIRTAIIYRPDHLTPVGSPAMYYQNDTNRPSLAQTFQPSSGAKASSQTFTFVVNHLRSKGSACGGGADDPLQGNCNGVRLNMAQNVVTWLGTNPTSDPLGASRRVLLVGDFNAYYGEDPIQYFQNNGYGNLIFSIIGTKAYSYNFGSEAGYLDHAMANGAMNSLVRSVAEWHNNADEPSSLQALDSADKSVAAQAAYYAADPYAASDHDPFVVGFNPLAGDLNDDGVVDTTDQKLITGAIGKNLSTLDRRLDIDGDGKVTANDYRLWTAYYRTFIQ